MQLHRIAARCFAILLLALLGMALGCNQEETSVDDNELDNDPFSFNDAEPWVTRLEIPESKFKPAKLENAINNLVTDLNDLDKDNSIRLAFIPKSASEYFRVSVEGAYSSIQELGIIGNVIAIDHETTTSEEGLTEQHISVMQEQVSTGVNGIGIAPAMEGLAEEIDAAVDQGVSVVIFDSDFADSKRHLYVGTMNANAGALAGQTMADLIGESVGTVLLLGTDSTDWVDGRSRTDEAKRVLEARGYTVVIQDSDWEGFETVEHEMVEKIETAEPPIVGCLGVFANSYQCADAAVTAGVISDIKVVAFDFEPPTLNYLETGEIQVTHAQRQYYMGYIVPYLLYAIEELSLEQTKLYFQEMLVDGDCIDTGIDVVYHDEVESYYNFLGALGVL